MKYRIVGYDLARALAVFGMVVVNFKIVMNADQSEPAWLVSLMGLLEGRAAATFVVLAGIGISLLSGKARMPGGGDRLAPHRHTLLRRAVFLFVVGLLYTPIWPADILHFYGVYIAASAFLLATPGRRLWIYVGSLVVGFALMLFFLDYERGWDWDTLSYDGLWTPSGMIRHLFFNGFHPVVPWLAFLLLGMILGRLNLGNPATRRLVFAWGAGVALTAEFASRLLIHVISPGLSAAAQEAVAAILGTTPMPPMPFYMLAAAGTACAVIAVSVAVGERYGQKAWLRPFVATGQLALTLYVAHVVIGMGTLEAIGRLEHQTLPFSLFASAVFCTAGAAFAHIWRKRFRQGPLEAAMRMLTDPPVRNKS